MKAKLAHAVWVFVLPGCIHQPPSAQHLRREILRSHALSAQWFEENQREDGLFNYSLDVRTGNWSGQDNIVRQVGGLLAVTRLYSYVRTDELQHVINRFRTAIVKLVQTRRVGETDIAIVPFDGVAKLNTSALYLLALCDMQDLGIPLTAKERLFMKPLSAGLMAMHPPSVPGFYYLYFVPAEHNKVTTYGTGEALYAIARYAAQTGDDSLIRWTVDVFTEYNESLPKLDLQDRDVRAFFPWALYYMSECHRRGFDFSAVVEEYVDAALAYRERYGLQDEIGFLKNMSSGEAPFLEGLSRAYEVLEKRSTRAQVLWSRYILPTSKNLLELQLTSPSDVESMSGYSPRADASDLVGGFSDDLDAERIRVDLNQHCIMALSNVLDLLRDSQTHLQ